MAVTVTIKRMLKFSRLKMKKKEETFRNSVVSGTVTGRNRCWDFCFVTSLIISMTWLASFHAKKSLFFFFLGARTAMSEA